MSEEAVEVVDPQALEADIKKLQTELERIIAGYRQVEHRDIAEESQFLSQISAIHEKRLASLAQYKTEEVNAAHRLRDGMLYGINNDHEQALKMVDDRVLQFIQFKVDYMCEELPNAAEFFKSHRDCNEFLKTFFKDKEQSSDVFQVTLSDDPLLSKEEITKCYDEILAAKNEFEVEIGENGEYVLRRGEDVFSVGTTAVLTSGDSNSYSGTVSSVARKQIGFMCAGKVVQVPVSALNMGFVELTKK